VRDADENVSLDDLRQIAGAGGVGVFGPQKLLVSTAVVDHDVPMGTRLSTVRFCALKYYHF